MVPTGGGVSAIYWAIWKARNNPCFNKKLIKNPLEIICHAGALMNFWVGLYPELDREAIEDGVNLMLKVALEIMSTKKNKKTNGGGGNLHGNP